MKPQVITVDINRQECSILGDYVALREFELPSSKGGIVLPDSAQADMKLGVVVAFGPGRWQYGTFVKVEHLRPGDVVGYGYRSVRQIKSKPGMDGETWAVIQAEDIIVNYGQKSNG